MMVAEKKRKEDEDGVYLPIVWHTPDGIISRYATNMVVQHDGHDFFLSFFEVVPPMVMGEDAENQIKELTSIKATCVSRIIIPKERMPSIVEALNRHVAKTKGENERVKKEGS